MRPKDDLQREFYALQSEIRTCDESKLDYLTKRCDHLAHVIEHYEDVQQTAVLWDRMRADLQTRNWYHTRFIATICGVFDEQYDGVRLKCYQSDTIYYVHTLEEWKTLLAGWDQEQQRSSEVFDLYLAHLSSACKKMMRSGLTEEEALAKIWGNEEKKISKKAKQEPAQEIAPAKVEQPSLFDVA